MDGDAAQKDYDEWPVNWNEPPDFYNAPRLVETCSGIIRNLNDLALYLTQCRYLIIALVIATYSIVIVQGVQAALRIYRHRQFLYERVPTDEPPTFPKKSRPSNPLNNIVQIQVTKPSVAHLSGSTSSLLGGKQLKLTPQDSVGSSASGTSSVPGGGGGGGASAHDWQMRQHRMMRSKRTVQQSFRKHLRYKPGETSSGSDPGGDSLKPVLRPKKPPPVAIKEVSRDEDSPPDPPKKEQKTEPQSDKNNGLMDVELEARSESAIAWNPVERKMTGDQANATTMPETAAETENQEHRKINLVTGGSTDLPVANKNLTVITVSTEQNLEVEASDKLDETDKEKLSEEERQNDENEEIEIIDTDVDKVFQ